MQFSSLLVILHCGTLYQPRRSHRVLDLDTTACFLGARDDDDDEDAGSALVADCA